MIAAVIGGFGKHCGKLPDPGRERLLLAYSAHLIEITALPRTSHSRQRSLCCKSNIVS